MTTALADFDTEVLQQIAQAPEEGYQAIDLINTFTSHSESDVQKAIAMLLVNRKIVLTMNRRLKPRTENE